MRIGVDFDGVIGEVDKKYAEFAEALDESNPMTRMMVEGVLDSPEWQEYTRNLRPIEGVSYLNTVVKNHEVFIVSRRLEKDRQTLCEWLKRNKLNILPENIYLRKDLNTSPIEHKKQACIKLKLDLLIDDSVTVVEAIPVARLFRGWRLGTAST